ncbi:hypothetical protein [Actinosynnema pretiosum]|uniref:hypothetical protein n=1 Tax=Actinosynnema pretiosum TaxID=42197 RepID=UPI0012FE362F|nr:hypothetical protein [Actinosynnema pretiosum]
MGDWALTTTSALLMLFSVPTARRLLHDARTAQAQAVDVHVLELVEALHLPVPESRWRLAALGDALTSTARDVPLDHERDSRRLSPGAVQDIADRLGRETQALVMEQREYLEMVLRTIRALPGDVAELRRREAGVEAELVLQTVDQAVERVLRGPAVVDFTGVLAVVEIWADSFDPQINFDVRLGRSRPIGHTPVLADVRLEGSASAEEAEFELVVDCSTAQVSPRRSRLEVRGEFPAHQVVSLFPFDDERTTHEVWVQLFQSGRFAQALSFTASPELDDDR